MTSSPLSHHSQNPQGQSCDPYSLKPQLFYFTRAKFYFSNLSEEGACTPSRFLLSLQDAAGLRGGQLWTKRKSWSSQRCGMWRWCGAVEVSNTILCFFSLRKMLFPKNKIWTERKLSMCMGTVESQPEPLINHLRQALSQLQGHRWMQFHLSDQKPGSTPPRPHLRADSQGGRISLRRSFLLEPFCKPRTQVRSLFHFSFVTW